MQRTDRTTKRPAPLPESTSPPLRTRVAQQPAPPTLQPLPHQPPHTAGRFAPKTTEEIVRARKKGIPKKTQEDTKYCVHIWDEWREYRSTSTGIAILPLQQLPPHQLNEFLTMFVLEARKKTGEVYQPNTLHHIVCGLMRHLRLTGNPQIDFFRDPEFSGFRASLDAEMKRLQGEGVGSKRKQAEVLTEGEENILWEKGLLGDSTPQSLLDTVVFYNGLYFALRSGQEHRQLRREPCQIEVVEHPGERPYLKYTEDTSKNHPGGLRGRNRSPLQHYQPPAMLHTSLQAVPREMPTRRTIPCILLASGNHPDIVLLVFEVCIGSYNSEQDRVPTVRVRWNSRIQDKSLSKSNSNESPIPLRRRRATHYGAHRSSESRGSEVLQKNLRHATRKSFRHSEPAKKT